MACAFSSARSLSFSSAFAPPGCLRVASPLRTASALCSALDENTLLRQSEVLELLAEVTDPSLVDLDTARSTQSADVVSLGLIRGVRTEDARCSLDLELPQDSCGLSEWMSLAPQRAVAPAAVAADARRAYFAAVSFVDEQVGTVLSELARLGLDNHTVVALHSDQGYHLGEHNQWRKDHLAELDARVPLLIRAPGPLGAKAAGKRTSALAQHVDIMPTLIDLAGLPIDVGEETPLSGVSLKPVGQESANPELSRPARQGPESLMGS